MIWVTLVILLVFFTALYFLSGSNPFYGNAAWALIGLLGGLIGGKEAS